MKKAKLISCVALLAMLVPGLAGCGWAERVRDDYWGKDTSQSQRVPRDEYGNPILEDDGRQSK